MLYFAKTPWWLKKLYPNYIWRMPADEKKLYLSSSQMSPEGDSAGNKLYLTFDDGPHPEITPFVLDELKKHNAKATFFCIGDNVSKYPQVYKRILEEGHAIGNHTHNHLDGWQTPDEAYFKNISEAAKWIDSKLFRPPYGRVTRFQAKQLMEKLEYNIIMWDVLSGDFDIRLSPERCLKNVVRHLRPGAIIVFHDSEKAYKRLSYALPEVLEEGIKKGYSFDKIIL